MSTLDDARAGMDLAVRPQDDLFGHVNGRWLAEAEIPSDRASWGPFVELTDRAQQQVREIIMEVAEPSDGALPDPATEAGKIAALFTSFMDTEGIAARGTAPLEPALALVRGIGSTGDVAGAVGRLERLGVGGLFGSYVDTDSKDSDRYLLNLTQGGLGLPDESYYRDDKFAEIRGKYAAYLERLIDLAGVPGAAATAARVLEIETRLAAGHWERSQTRDVQRTYNLKTADELAVLAPAFDFRAWVEGLGGSPATIAETCVRQPSYLEHLSAVLGEISVDDWRAFLTVRVLRASAPYLTDDFVEVNFDFYGRTLGGTPQLRARWKRGVALVEGALGEAVGRIYVERHFPPESKRLMDELVGNLLAAYRTSIAALGWMTEETKQRAYDKLAAFRPKIGYPVRFRDYSALEVTAGDLMGNVRAASAFETDRELGKIGSPVDRDEWFMLPQTVNAYYNPGTNEICFPAGILQKPFFSPDAHPAENYGGIGSVIGHEIGHGFDDQGAQYDGAGNLNDWWTPADKAAFEVKSKALVTQYDGFSPRNLPGEHVNGALTVGENIGDLGGLTIGHTAFGIAQGGDIDPDDSRTLFLSWAYCWRTKLRREQEQQLLTIDPHSPPEFRANIVRNLDEFHAAFDTTPDDGLWLDPEERVRIW